MAMRCWPIAATRSGALICSASPIARRRRFSGAFTASSPISMAMRCLDKMTKVIRPTPHRLAALFRFVRPEASKEDFVTFLKAQPATRQAQCQEAGQAVRGLRLPKIQFRGSGVSGARASAASLARAASADRAGADLRAMPGRQAARPRRRRRRGCSRRGGSRLRTSASSRCWRRMRSRAFTRAGRGSAIPSRPWCRPMPPRSAAPPTARRRWRPWWASSRTAAC